MYIQKADYKGRISLELLNLLLQEDEAFILGQASKIAEDTLLSLAGVLYDIPPELLKTGTDRNYYVLGLAISIALYEIYQRSDDEEVPEKVIKNHDDALNELAQVSKGKTVLSLPPKPDPANTTNGSDPNAPQVDYPGEGGIPANATEDGLHYQGGEFIKPQLTGLRRVGSQRRRTHMP